MSFYAYLHSSPTPFTSSFVAHPLFRSAPICPISARPSFVRMQQENGKRLTYREKARELLVSGINQVSDAVKVTLGPRGRNVVLEREDGVPEIVNDGVTIARCITLENLEENAGARLLVQVASKTDLKAGDGTTTSCVLTQELVKLGMKQVTGGRNPMALKRGMGKATKFINGKIATLARKVKGLEDLEAIATISAGNDEAVGELIANAVHTVGEYGTTVIEESQTIFDEVDFTEGMELDRGYIDPIFINDPLSVACVFRNARVLITDHKIQDLNDIVPILEATIIEKRPLLIICEDVLGDALQTLRVNKDRGVIDVCAIKSPGFGIRKKEYLEDIAIVTNGTFITGELGLFLKDATIEDLGQCDSITVTAESTLLVSKSGNRDKIAKRIKQIKAEVDATDSAFDFEKGTERMARLGGGIARIKVGAATETELKDKKLRFEDALNATKAARESGVVPGGGAMFLYCKRFEKDFLATLIDEDEILGAKLVFKAIEAPARQIADNAGIEGVVVVYNVLNQELGYGYNAKTETYENLFETGVIDPARVTMSALENATSVAEYVLTTECIITKLPPKIDKNKAKGAAAQAGMPGGMAGMTGMGGGGMPMGMGMNDPATGMPMNMMGGM